MPKTEIDYSNTIIYKITCKEESCKEVYVGHTTNFVQRKHAHKQSCINKNSTNHNLKLYKIIRENGGWDNWNMEIVHFFKCENSYDARKKEQEFFESLHATLNSIQPLPIQPKKTKLEHKIIKVSNKKNYVVLNNSETELSKCLEFTQENKKPFMCEKCMFTCSKQSDWNRHISTQKHHKLCGISQFVKFTPEVDKGKFTCEKCNNIYKCKSGLWYHKKRCKLKIEDKKIDEQSFTTMFLEMMKQNEDFKKIMIDQTTKMMEIAQNIQQLPTQIMETTHQNTQQEIAQ